MFTNEETIAIFEKNGFEYLDGIDFNYRQKILQEKYLRLK